MDKIIQYIKKRTDDKFERLSFQKGIYKKNLDELSLNFSFDRINEISNDDKKLIKDICKEYLGDTVKNIKVNIKSNLLTTNEIKDQIYKIIDSKEELKNINRISIKFNFNNDTILVVIPYNEGMINCDISQLKEDLQNDIYCQINYNVIIELKEIEIKNTKILDNKYEQIIEDNYLYQEIKNSQIVKIDKIENVLGEILEKEAFLAGNFGDKEDIVVVGTVKNCRKKEIKSKDNDEEKSKQYLSFELEYERKNTMCILFLTKSEENIEELTEGETYVIQGKVNNYNGQKSVKVSKIAKCTFIPPKKVWKKCPTEYNYIKPEPYEFLQQSSLFFEEQKTTNEYLLNNTFVVYDLETTGINPEFCKIIDIGAYKIIDGKIIEKFCSFVNPECEIPEEASKVNRITNAMVENSPTIEMALPDFYKFCYGSVIVGYNNIGFDDLFIINEAKKQYYNFDNKRDDAFVIAKKKIGGLRNYKLSTVCEYENIPLIDAHRASNDALATAKLFIKLVEKYY